MRGTLDGDKPIYVQIKEWVEDQILRGDLQDGDQIPSTNEIVQFFRVNHLTVAKGMNILADEGLIYKRRGLGMFVETGAKDKLLKKHKEGFEQQYLYPMLKEAKKIGLKDSELMAMIKEVKEKRLNQRSLNQESMNHTDLNQKNSNQKEHEKDKGGEDVDG